MTFEDLKNFIDKADEVIRVCDAGKATYTSNAAKALQHLNDAFNGVKTARKENKKTAEDTAETLKQKAANLYTALEASKKQQLHFANIYTKMAEFIEDTLEEEVGKATRNVFKYRTFRTKLQNDLVATKVELAMAITQLSHYLEEKDVKEKVQERATIFLVELRKTNFYNTSKADKKRLVDAFQELTKSYWFGRNESEVRSGTRKEYKLPLENMMDKAIEYTENSGICWSHCHRLRDKLDNNKYINEVRAELNVTTTEEDIRVLKGDITREEEKIKAMIAEFDPQEAEAMLQQLAAVKIPKEIDYLKLTYNLANWTYENLGETAGHHIGLPQDASFEYAVNTPDLDASVSIPIFSTGFVRVGFEFGASLTAGVSADGNLTLHNFLSASEPLYVSGTLNASAKVEASAYAGISVVLIELIKGTGKIVLTGSAELKAAGKVELKKADIDQLAVFSAETDAGISFLLAGHLEAVVGLTAPLKFLIKKITGKDAEIKWESPSLDFFEAKRNATVTFEMPFRKKPTNFPKDTLSVDKGEWEVKFIAQEQLVALWREKYGGLEAWNEVQDQHPLSEDEIQNIHAMYADFGQRPVEGAQ